MADKVVISGVGIQLPRALGAADFGRLLREGRMRENPSDGSCVIRAPQTAAERLQAMSEIEGLLPGTVLPRRCSRQLGLALLAASEAVQKAGGRGAVAPDRWAVYVAGEGQTSDVQWGLHQTFARQPAAVRPSDVQSVWATDVAASLAELVGSTGETMVVGGASAAGSCGLVAAARAIQSGACDAALVVSSSDHLDPATVQAFVNVGAAGAPGVTGIPLDAEQHGLVLTEAGAAVLLESQNHAAARGGESMAVFSSGVVRGGGSRGTRPNLEREQSTFRLALEQAGLASDAIDLINLHATGTALGDAVELEAVSGVFEHGPVLQATKALVGHALGAASLVEAVACCLQIAGEFIHPTPVPHPVRADLDLRGQQRPVHHVMSNAFGFGGVNSSLILSRPLTARHFEET
ncbi:MAG: beta-ketoacyl synthase N-terminal-like domain-containing protein [Cutibacterium avidum]|uniref:Ketosynthase family 3 (KS3) domain-containing protein n=2 Tax=Cutibacterium avidum TaxID=33010 RepID=A0A3E2DLY1_9ACTN|nr:beta-ketoacyl synthase N-terminal-like domain-containing protein [Cutibacterium avidum]MBS5746162.1 hypothetical protein [Propionibacterium sp.]MDU7817405.1 beta-ketoacyl synthase N-terminal-like domain-containing protein [Bacillota bacterium]MDK7360075.1 beta-ketoacyl synthase N-terminal-like domain-containing protein [Cutibacterium avidum]MDU2073248.1 beta-ketoacyl synthase N-terminal-like domain-containing protein [Cutibacterium avidum]MDU3220436.1 beta-ketoacyl synthase N-terminal-like 